MSRKIDRLDRFAEIKNLSDNQITKDCGLAIGTLGKSRKEGKDLSRRTSELVLKRYRDLDRNWFLTGEGSMLVSPAKIDTTQSFPLIEAVKAECGRTFSEITSVMKDECKRIMMPGIPDGTDFFIKATGYSMVNEESPELSIPPGAYVGLCHQKGAFMRWGEAYAVATSDGIMIKKLLPSEEGKDVIRCVSYNPSYEEFSIRKEDLYDYARVTCVVPVMVR